MATVAKQVMAAFVSSLLSLILLAFASLTISFFNGLFGLILVIIFFGAVLGVVLFYFSQLAELSGTGRVLFASCTPALGLLLGGGGAGAIMQLQSQVELLNAESAGGAAMGGGLVAVFGPSAGTILTVLCLIYFIGAYIPIFAEFKKGEVKDFLWLLLPVPIFLLTTWVGLFLAGNIVHG